MANENDGEPNREQATYWNEQGGPNWVEMEQDLDAQLEPLGVAVADALALVSGERVLDVGCGAGATSRMLAERVRTGEVVGIDISAVLLARARQRATDIARVRFEDGDAQTFAFADASFDAVFSRLGVMFFADPVAAFRNLHAALRPGGRLGFVCWRAMRENPMFTLPLEAGRPFLAERPEAMELLEPAAPGPFAFADGARLRSVLESAGFADVGITPHDEKIVVAGRRDLDAAVDLVMRIGPLGRALSTLAEARRAHVRRAVRDAFAPYHGASGVRLPSATWIVTGRRSGLGK